MFRGRTFNNSSPEETLISSFSTSGSLFSCLLLSKFSALQTRLPQWPVSPTSCPKQHSPPSGISSTLHITQRTVAILLLEGTILEYFMACRRKLLKSTKNRGHKTNLSPSLPGSHPIQLHAIRAIQYCILSRCAECLLCFLSIHWLHE